MPKKKQDFPLKLNIRDTELYDDLGGSGKRIYTTAGNGYETQEYVRADAHAIPSNNSWQIQRIVKQLAEVSRKQQLAILKVARLEDEKNTLVEKLTKLLEK